MGEESSADQLSRHPTIKDDEEKGKGKAEAEAEAEDEVRERELSAE